VGSPVRSNSGCGMVYMMTSVIVACKLSLAGHATAIIGGAMLSMVMVTDVKALRDMQLYMAKKHKSVSAKVSGKHGTKSSDEKRSMDLFFLPWVALF
jgi:hypothetical protein